MERMIYPIINLIYIYTIVSFLDQYFLQRATKLKRVYPLAMIAAYVMIEMTALYSKNSLVILGVNIACIFFLSLFYKSKLSRKMMATALFYVIGFAIESLWLCIYSAATSMTFEDVTNNIPTTMLIAAISRLSFLVIAKVCARLFGTMKKEEHQPLSIKYWLFVFLIPAASIAVIYILFKNLMLSKEHISVAIGIAMMLLINFFAFYLYDLLLKESAIEQENSLLTQQNEMLMQQFHENAKTSEAIKKVHHDIKNITLAVLSEVEDLNLPNRETIQKKFETLLDSMQWQNGQAQSGFAAVDVIINYKANFAAQNQIVIESQIKISEDYSMDNQAVAIVLGNSLDNAIEACMGLPPEERKIDIFILQKNTNLYMSICNPYQGEIIFDDAGLPQTSKKKAGHGIGSKNVQTIVEKTGGYILYDTVNHIFKIDILFF